MCIRECYTQQLFSWSIISVRLNERKILPSFIYKKCDQNFVAQYFYYANYDEDNRALPFEDESINIVTSSLSLHWVNNLPGLFKEVNRVLKKDGVFIGSMFGGDTLYEVHIQLGYTIIRVIV